MCGTTGERDIEHKQGRLLAEANSLPCETVLDLAPEFGTAVPLRAYQIRTIGAGINYCPIIIVRPFPPPPAIVSQNPA
jgi:hypothetical protein